MESRRTSTKWIRTLLSLVMAIAVSVVMFPATVQAAEVTTEPIGVTVTLAGDTPTTPETFQVELTREDPSSPMPAGAVGDTASITINGQGEGSFAGISFTHAGTYFYTVSQKAGSATGYIYDTRTYGVTVYVTNSADGLTTDSIIVVDQTTNRKVDGITFYNSYVNAPEPGTTGNLKITMELHGEIPAGEKIEITVVFEGTGDTSFLYTDAEGNVLGQITSGDKLNLGDGDVIIILNLPVGIKYTVTQTPKPYYTTDPITGIHQGVIVAGQTSLAPFVNTYDTKKPGPVSVDPGVQKQVAGTGAPTDSVFTFRMKATDDRYPMPEAAVDGTIDKQITGAGSVEMGWITYTRTGTYTYKITEVKGTLEGYTYDETVYTMTVKVTEDHGLLKASQVIVNSDNMQVNNCVFVNRYRKGTSGDTGGGGGTDDGGTIGSGGTNGVGATGSGLINRITNVVKTGDLIKRLPYLLSLLAAIAVVIGIIMYRRKRGKDDDDERP